MTTWPRYLHATQSGALTRDSLKEVIAELEVIAPHVLIRPPGERASAQAPEGETLCRGDGEPSPACARDERDLEAGS